MLYDLRVRLSHIQQDLATLLTDIPMVPMRAITQMQPEP
jgi:hypothetical protein